MGGTGSTSRNTTDILTEIAIGATQRTLAKCVMTATQAQLLNIAKVKGDVVIRGVSMRQGSTVNMKCALSAASQSTMQSSIANDIVQWAESQGEAFIGALGQSTAEATTNIRNALSFNVSQETVQEAMNMMTQEQTVNAVEVDGNVTVEGLSMDQTLEMTAEAIITGTAYSTAISDIANKIDQSTKATQTNPLAEIIDSAGNVLKGMFSTWVFLILGLVIAGAIVMVFFIRYFFNSGAATQLIASGERIAQQGLKSQTGASPLSALGQ